MRSGTALGNLIVWRFTLALPLLIIAAGGFARMRVTPRHALKAVVLGGGGQAVITVLSLSALRFIPAATLSFLFYTYPAWIAIFAVVRGSERVDARSAGALLLALTGIVVMVGSPWSQPMPLTGVGLALGAAVLYALYVPMLNQLQRGIHPAAASAWIVGGGAVFMVLLGVIDGTLSLRMPAEAWVLSAILAVVSTVLAFMLFMNGLKVLGPVRTAIVATAEPFATAVLAALFLAQPITATTLAGGALIAAAVMVLQWRAA